MKNFLLIFVFLLLNARLFAQFGVLAGVNATQFQSSKYTDSFSPILAINVGIFFEVPMSKHTDFTLGFNISTKGAVLDHNLYFPLINYTAHIHNETRLPYLEIPFNFSYHLKNGLFIGAGPYVALGLYKSQIGITEDDFKSSDYGVEGKVGFKFSTMGLGLYYSHGLFNILNIKDVSLYNRVLAFKTIFYFESKG